MPPVSLVPRAGALLTPQVVEAQVEVEAVLKRTLKQLIDQREGESATLACKQILLLYM